MSSRIYIEGGGDSKELHIRCRGGFRQLLEKCGFAGRMPRLVASGTRNGAYEGFETAHRNAGEGDFVAMLVDSEDPAHDIEGTWEHLRHRDGWDRPDGAEDNQVLLMITCMESWIAADRGVLRSHYGSDLQESALPALHDMEARTRDDIQDNLTQATRNCRNAYEKGKRSFEIVGKITPEELRRHLPSFVRLERVLKENL